MIENYLFGGVDISYQDRKWKEKFDDLHIRTECSILTLRADTPKESNKYVGSHIHKPLPDRLYQKVDKLEAVAVSASLGGNIKVISTGCLSRYTFVGKLIIHLSMDVP